MAALILIGSALACSRDTTSPVDPAAGTYTATSFITTPTGGPSTDQLTAGSTVNLSLDADYVTSGHLHIAASGSTPATDTDLIGTWTHIGNAVDLSQPLDSFMRDMIFLIDKTPDDKMLLVGDQVISGTRIQLTLTRVTLAED
jgi:hypothetical protein